jgi:hypothetical protein
MDDPQPFLWDTVGFEKPSLGFAHQDNAIKRTESGRVVDVSGQYTRWAMKGATYGVSPSTSQNVNEAKVTIGPKNVDYTGESAQ